MISWDEEALGDNLLHIRMHKWLKESHWSDDRRTSGLGHGMPWVIYSVLGLSNACGTRSSRKGSWRGMGITLGN
jgi:hypothetical protein